MNEFNIGDEVKVPDVGPLGKVIDKKDDLLYIEISGEKMWIAADLCENPYISGKDD